MADEKTGEEVTPTTEQATGDKSETVENKEGGDNTQKPQDDGAEIPVRRSPREYINERRSRRLAKVETTDLDDEDDDELEPAGRKAIAREVSEQVSPIVKQTQEQADETELRQFLMENPDFRPFEVGIRKNMKVHTTMPIRQLAYAVAGDKLLAIGATKKAKADQEAQDNNLGATTGRKAPANEPDYANMSDDEFKLELRRAKGQRV